MYLINIDKRKHRFQVEIEFDTSLGLGIAIGYDGNVHPTEYIFQLVLLNMLFTIRIR